MIEQAVLLTLKSYYAVSEMPTYLARWRTHDGIEFNATHGPDGTVTCTQKPFGIKLNPPQLTAKQMEAATPLAPDPQPPAPSISARDLAAKGASVRPDWANRYEKAADLVEADKVQLIGQHRAVVTGDSNTYAVNLTSKQCTCPWMQHHPGDPCSHYLAARMAIALQGDDDDSDDESAKEARSEAIAAANRERKLRRNAEVQVLARERDKKHNRRFVDGDGARTYVHMAMANGAKTIPQHIMNRAQPGLSN